MRLRALLLFLLSEYKPKEDVENYSDRCSEKRNKNSRGNLIVNHLAALLSIGKTGNLSIGIICGQASLISFVGFFRKRNFENGVLTDDPSLVEPLVEQFDSVWRGAFCRDCGRRTFCDNPAV